jgi:aminoglycoside 3-N-acetyltransferase I
MQQGHGVTRIRSGDHALFSGLLDVFASAFEDPRAYGSARPSSAYADKLLASDHFIALVAIDAGAVVGGLTAYELVKYEQERSELYLYDLAVLESHRRRGVATDLIEALTRLGSERGASVVFVQADYGDEPAIALYTKLGVREDVMHFDIPVRPLR